MRNPVCGAVLLLAGSIIINPPMQAQTSLHELAAQVLADNPEIASQREVINGLAARVSEARGGYLPQIEANGVIERRRLIVEDGKKDNSDATFTAKQADIEARVTVFDGFVTNNAIKTRIAELQAGRASFDAAAAQVLLDLISAYADVRRDWRIQEYAQQQYEAIADQQNATNRRLQFGEATKTDSAQAEARLASSKTNILTANQDLAVSRSSFLAVAGRSADNLPPPAPFDGLPASLDEARQIALVNNPQLLSAAKNVEAARRAKAAAKGALAPSIQIVTGAQYLSGGVTNVFTGKLPDDRSAMYGGVQIRVPIFQQGREYAEIRRSRALENQRRFEEDQAERDVTRNVETAWSQWQSAVSVIEAAKVAVAANERAAEGVRKESLSGNRTLLDVLDAQTELLNSRATLERAIRNEYVGRAAVLAAIGRLTLAAIPQ
ncbi:hypothetical protein L288_12465 [Sphingobium quisquiliarum P25]|uniref:Type I secretion protein TolC n=1 Tax=Sphingobium quisquiliarum P25 TaxID=1329909 RepID=T0GXN1_9SPHN|nr:TolC family outer membrane protein [Sphingobium quisquiliarum]EQB05452.1 hypothetical protein L288_12465 [Sphingobium quisquiliarum P25]